MNTTASNDLSYLLDNLRPHRKVGRYVVVTAKPGTVIESPLAVIEEDEGTTFVLTKEEADIHGYCTDTVFSWLTLRVKSSLTAVGLTAAVSTALAEAGISCNLLAGYHHDHILVPEKTVESALSVLLDLSRQTSHHQGETPWAHE